MQRLNPLLQTLCLPLHEIADVLVNFGLRFNCKRLIASTEGIFLAIELDKRVSQADQRPAKIRVERVGVAKQLGGFFPLVKLHQSRAKVVI